MMLRKSAYVIDTEAIKKIIEKLDLTYPDVVRMDELYSQCGAF